MEVYGVLVSCGHGNELVRCSGILFSHRWILTQGALLSPALLGNQNSFSEVLESQNLVLNVPENFRKKLPSISVILEEHKPERFISNMGESSNFGPLTLLSGVSVGKLNLFPKKDKKLTVISNGCNPELLNIENIRFTESRKEGHIGEVRPTVNSRIGRVPEERPAHLVGLWRCPLLAQALNTLLTGWTFSEDSDATIPNRLRPVLVLLRMGEVAGDARAALHNLALQVAMAPHPKRGDTVLIETTPFGSRFFLNSWSQGIICNIGGPGNCIVLTDARTALGCEGGPMFQDDRSGQLIGLVVSSLCWWRGEWVGYTMGVALKPVLERLFTDLIPSPSLTSNNGIGYDDSVVLVRCGYGWGSGVVVDSSVGTILTCSHVVRKASESKITVYCKGRHFSATLLYHTRDGLAYDIAVLRVINALELSTLAIAKEPPTKGEEVLTLAFPLLSEYDDPILRPSMMRGTVSHVADFMVQTTCCIQSGASGGAILRNSGELLALVVCNVVDTDTGALYPHMNMSIPSTVFCQPLELFRLHGDPTVLQCLESQDSTVQRMWALKQYWSNKL